MTLAEPMTQDTDVPPGLRVLRHEGALVGLGPTAPETTQLDLTAPGTTLPKELRRIVDTYRVVDLAIEESDLEDVMRTAYLREQTPRAVEN